VASRLQLQWLLFLLPLLLLLLVLSLQGNAHEAGTRGFRQLHKPLCRAAATVARAYKVSTLLAEQGRRGESDCRVPCCNDALF
jgi:hypothetical protein